jgi:hypothetical protein
MRQAEPDALGFYRAKPEPLYNPSHEELELMSREAQATEPSDEEFDALGFAREKPEPVSDIPEVPQEFLDDLARLTGRPWSSLSDRVRLSGSKATGAGEDDCGLGGSKKAIFLPGQRPVIPL